MRSNRRGHVRGDYEGHEGAEQSHTEEDRRVRRDARPPQIQGSAPRDEADSDEDTHGRARRRRPELSQVARKERRLDGEVEQARREREPGLLHPPKRAEPPPYPSIVSPLLWVG